MTLSSRWSIALRALGLILTLCAVPETTRAAVWIAEMETGLAGSSYNDVRIPGNDGTLFSLTDDLRLSVSPYVRGRVGVLLAERHSLLATFAPLRLEAHGTLSREVRFVGTTFPAGSSVSARYRFDSYRFTYRYSLLLSERAALAVGATAFIRDAAISLQGASFAEKTNTGFVPLLSFRVVWRFTPPLSLVIDGEALAAPQGRAEDVLLAIEALVRPGVTFRVGYRFIEGGANNRTVYNFALIHHLSVGVAVEL